LSKPELLQINEEVGLLRTKGAVFGVKIHDWTNSKGKEKRAPEEVLYWNALLTQEIKEEVDMYLCCVIDKATDCIPTLEYHATGFDKAGVTILFGGDHGDHHSPISFKLNFSSPL
jgi:hypothetical protein